MAVNPLNNVEAEGIANMRSVVIYDSEYGNTRQIAEVVAAELRTTGDVEVENVHEVDLGLPLPADTDLLVVGGPTQIHGISSRLRAQLAAIPEQALCGMVVEAFDTRAHGPRLLTGAASGGIAKALKRKGATPGGEPESFIVLDKEGPLAEGELERARLWARSILARMPVPTGSG